MTDGQQQTIIIDADGPGFWSLLEKFLDDLLSQQLPASVVLLLMAALISPWILRFIWRWWFGTSRRD